MAIWLFHSPNHSSSDISPLAEEKPHHLPVLFPSKGSNERLRAGCNEGNSWNCSEKKVLDSTGMTSRFAANGNRILPHKFRDPGSCGKAVRRIFRNTKDSDRAKPTYPDAAYSQHAPQPEYWRPEAYPRNHICDLGQTETRPLATMATGTGIRRWWRRIGAKTAFLTRSGHRSN